MILFIKSLVFVLFIVKSLSTSSDDGVKYANKCEGLYDIIYGQWFLMIKGEILILIYVFSL